MMKMSHAMMGMAVCLPSRAPSPHGVPNPRAAIQQRLGELEAMRGEFKRQRYDDVHSAFADGALLEVMLQEFLGGLVSADNLWRTIQQQHQVSRIRSDPIFGSGEFGRPGSIWQVAGWAADVAKGGFRTGGDF